MCFSASEFKTDGQMLDSLYGGVSPLFYFFLAMGAMDVIVRASNWILEGVELLSGEQPPPVRTYMHDMTTITTTTP